MPVVTISTCFRVQSLMIWISFKHLKQNLNPMQFQFLKIKCLICKIGKLLQNAKYLLVENLHWGLLKISLPDMVSFAQSFLFAFSLFLPKKRFQEPILIQYIFSIRDKVSSQFVDGVLQCKLKCRYFMI